MRRNVARAFACGVLLVLCVGALEMARASSAADHPSSSCGSAERVDGVSGAEWTGNWSWPHFGWRCVLRYEDGRLATVYFR